MLRVKYVTRKHADAEDQRALRKLLRGIVVAGRHYKFFGYKDSGAERARTTEALRSTAVTYCFVCIKSDANRDNGNFRTFDSIGDARNFLGHFNTVSNLSKRFARFQLTFSRTNRVPLNFSKITVEDIDDIECEDGITTDGAGFVSEDIARLCMQYWFSHDRKTGNMATRGMVIPC